MTEDERQQTTVDLNALVGYALRIMEQIETGRIPEWKYLFSLGCLVDSVIGRFPLRKPRPRRNGKHP